MKKLVSLVLLATIILCNSFVMAANVNFADINSSHWAYGSISDLVSKGTVNGYPDGTFRPNGTVTFAEFEKMITGVWKNNPTPISREAALEMLFKYSDSPKSDYVLPSIITNQMKNLNSVTWGYSTGLMQGNDGLNLRPDDTLTRAEAATLIVRSKNLGNQKHTFEESISGDLLKLIWDSYGIFDSEYVADETVTAKELQDAAKRLSDSMHFNMTIASNTIEDAAVAIIYSSVSQAKIDVISAKNKGIVTDKYGFAPQLYTAYGLENGITLSKAYTETATKKDVALILIQADALFGRKGVKINKDLSSYPSNYKDFAFIQEGVPKIAYSTPFDNGAKPASYYNFVSSFTSIFDLFVNEMQSKYCGGQAKLTLIPSLICQSKKEAMMRVKCTLTGEKTAYELFGAGYENAGREFYMDLNVGDVITNIYIPTDNAKIGKFICNQ